jgi:drug/metabolite transporter (DMT)-like permease
MRHWNDLNVAMITMIAVVVLLLSAGQVLFKYAAQSLDFSRPISFLSVPLMIALVLYGGATLCWLLVLTKVPLNVAFPFYGLVFLLVPVLSWLILKEQPNGATFLGSIIIAVGVVVVAMGSRA